MKNVYGGLIGVWIFVVNMVLAQEILPPELPWNGKSQSLVVATNNPWITPIEQSNFKNTPRYKETIKWLSKLVKKAPELEMVSLGKSSEKRDIWMIIASKEQTFTPEKLKASGKPIFLAQAGIHSGEIDGKDAGMMLLRDMTVLGSKRSLLDKVNFLFIPILSVDGHERFSKYGRVNQRGPSEMGWRTNRRNLNLNRDYAKIDTPEMVALIHALNVWSPDLYYDIHVTDGVDYQYDITFGYNGAHTYSPNIFKWLDNSLSPTVYKYLSAWGHIPGPLVFAIDEKNIYKGIDEWTATPRFSNGYGDARQLPTILVENHSLKPYKQRVLGTYILLEATLQVLANSGKELRTAIIKDRQIRRDPLPFKWQADGIKRTTTFLGVSSELHKSPISGDMCIRWTGKPETMEIPVVSTTKPAAHIKRPKSYWISPNWPRVIERLRIHGIQMEHIKKAVTVNVEMYRIQDEKFAGAPYEGHMMVTGRASVEKHRREYPIGSVRIPVDQELGTLAMLLLEPDSPDSFFQWGFFLEIFQRTEYIEDYAVEPMARQMLADNPTLKKEFAEKLATDSEFAKSPGKRLHWFYQRSPFIDHEWRLYPVGRELSE